ncbi:EAL domain-containing protein [Labrenzia sp. PHM005]|uniref:EAL domain-containing protein n=1 Tax=Labrenzia sp. PHM005 TaxID=2590016 RepID=UPI001AD9422E|nr:EAL domain-containing protein [Labrenzia sp. PHM005]
MQIRHGLVRVPQSRSNSPDDFEGAKFYADLLEALPAPAAYIRLDGRILLSNTKFAEICKASGYEAAAQNLRDMLSEAGWGHCQAALSMSLNGLPALSSGTIEFNCGAVLCNHLVCTSFVSLAKDQPAVLVQFEQRTIGQTNTGAAGRRSGSLLSGMGSNRPDDEGALLKHFPDDVLVFDPAASSKEKAGRILQAIDSAYDAADLATQLGEHPVGVTQTLYIPETGLLQGTETDRRMCEIRLVPLPGTGEEIESGTMAIIRRNVDCPHEVAENRRLAYQDPLTSLANRRAFTKSLDTELLRLAKDETSGLAVFYIDLDEFKKVNDLGGHDAGDSMLQRVASSLALTLGEFGTAARIGGDEFAGMLPAVNQEAAMAVAENILEAFARIRLEVADRVFTIGGSIGVAYAADWASAENCDGAGLLALADRACLRGKRFGGQSVQVHSVQARDCPSVGGCVETLPEFGNFQANELTLYSMPIVCLKKQKNCGAEILLRLQGDLSQGLSSKAWISAAERSGFIAQVDSWTLDKVLDAAERSPTRTILTMNVSAESARDSNFRDSLYQRLSINPLLASRLCLEISEKDFLREPADISYFIKFVSDLGCQTAIDDFAGHWPVLSRLTGLRVDWLKLAAGVPQEAMNDPAKASLLKALVSAARELGLKTIAKHVEARDEAEFLSSLDIEAAQGFYFGRPEPWPEAS